MKNLKTYEEFLFEDSPLFTFDGCQLEVGKSVVSFDGFSGIIVSKETVNGKVTYRDNKGVIRVCESQELIESINEADITWWEVAKGILAADIIKAGTIFAGGGLLVAAHIFTNWKKSIANKIDKIRKEEKFKELKEEANKIAEKFNGDSTLNSMLSDLAKYPYIDVLYIKGKREKNKATQNNKERTRIMREIAKYVKSKLTEDEKVYFVEINKILRDKPNLDSDGNVVEEDLTTQPERMVGTGTSTPVSPTDQNVGVGGFRSTDDSIGVSSIFRT